MSRKLEIIETARTLFNASNTQAVTTNHIAKAMGISAGNLHYHYRNREEIIRVLYIQLREESSLDIEELPKDISTLNGHHTLLIQIQWKYRFIFRELLFLFARDEKLRVMYVADNMAHRIRIKKVMQNLVEHGALDFPHSKALEHLVDSILMAWQFYTSYRSTLGEYLDENTIKEVIDYTNQAMQVFRTTTLKGQK
ncbi:MAG: TetR/AcrR family transcriptional regulator [Sulfurovum sp.]|nr:TetR/AcrR family transcriptional regulator [Sulfurovum sp.]